jgi:predicted ABC-type transport system involved in lysophospholipase L1 biosynthesis ATPase subunit
MNTISNSGMRLEAQKVEKAYWMKPHRLDILRGADLAVKPGEKVAIVGMSGAGKSTLLHILGALDSPDKGSIMIDGEDLSQLSNKKKAAIRAQKIGFVFQSYNLLHEMDVVENVMLPAMASSDAAVTGRKYRARATELLQKAGVGERLSHRPLELSGGEQQRVAIARALMNEPILILADEPTGNLDDVTGKQVLDMLFSLSEESDASLVVVTHNEAVAEACDRKVRLVEGLLVEQ